MQVCNSNWLRISIHNNIRIMLLSPGLISLSIAFVLHSDLASFYLHYLSLELVDQIRYLLCASFLLILHLVSDGVTNSMSCLNSWLSLRMEALTSTSKRHSHCRVYLVLSIMALTFSLNSFISRTEKGRQLISRRLNVTSVLESVPAKEERSY